MSKSSGTPEGPLPPDQYTEWAFAHFMLDRWPAIRNECLRGRDSVDRALNQGPFAGQAEINDIGLVIMPDAAAESGNPEICFIQWAKAFEGAMHLGSSSVRKVRLDHLNRFIYNIPAFVKPFPLPAGTEIIVPVIAGAVTTKAGRASARTACPQWALDLQAHLDAHKFQSPSLEPCVACRKIGNGADPDPPWNVQARFRCCPQCTKSSGHEPSRSAILAD